MPASASAAAAPSRLLKSRGLICPVCPLRPVRVCGPVSLSRLSSVQDRKRKKKVCQMGLSASRGWAPDQGTQMRHLCAPGTRAPVTALSDGQSWPSDPEQHSLLHPEPLPPMGSAYSKFGVDVPFDPEYSLVTSPVCTPRVLAFARLLCGFYYLVYFIFKLSWDSIHFPQDLKESVHLRASPIHLCLTRAPLRFFSYFTHLSAIGLCAYLWADRKSSCRERVSPYV